MENQPQNSQLPPAEPDPAPQAAAPAPDPAYEPPKVQSPVDTPSLRWRHLHRFKAWYASHKKWSIPATVLVLLIILAGVPWTRYNIAGLFLKKDFTIEVTDSTAHTPVSGAVASVGGISATTNGSGKATLKGLKVGPRKISIAKKYYTNKTTNLTVPILNQKNTPDVALVATGRQVKVSVTNLINKKVLGGVQIEIADTTATTDSSGNALLVLPADATGQKAKLSLSGYNPAEVTIQTSASSVKQNNYKLTPAGKIYFISNSTGKLNVMKTNLDGTGTEIAVSATGNEQASGTFLLQSADGKYVALVSKRTASDATPQLYVLSAADDKLLQVDTGNAIFQMYDWVGDTLIYTAQRQDLPVWQQGASKIKAYNAATGGTTLLDQSAGSDSATNANEYYSEIMVAAKSVVYGKIWQGTGDFTAKQNSLQVIGIDGENHQTLANYKVADNLYFAQHSPDTLYIWQHAADTGVDTYSQYTAGGSIKTINITSDQFYQGQNSYYFSASRTQTFWGDNRDGKETLLVGDQSGASPATILSLSDYDAYGWFSDQYLLLSKNNSELYIIGVKSGTPIKVTDYQSSSFGGN